MAVGIIVGEKLPEESVLYFLVLTIIFLIILLLNKNYRYSYSLIFGISIQLFFIFLGVAITQHYNKKPTLIENGSFIGVVLETPLEKQNSYKSVIKMEAAFYSDSVLPIHELVIVYFSKTDSVKHLKSGDVILFNKTPQTIENNNNPYEFDYKKYLKRKRVYRQVYLPADSWIKTKQNQLSPLIIAEQTREKLLQIYRSQPIDETEFEILSALTLGYKRELDPETKRIFSASGASHVLAVSGLHVGIIFWILNILFGFLQKMKTGRILFVIISISILWIYAFIAGLSPSVMRASTMFSIFVIGENINRKPNTYNSLAASAFLLLLINPNNLYDIGFQLSYAAVFGIVFLQPKLEKTILVKTKLLKFFWELITVSISAQIATFPLTSFYFGQFPTYFWLTNTFVIPAVMILIPLGILLLIVSKLYIVSTALAFLLNIMIKITYFLLSFINELPFSVFDISIGSIQLVLLLSIVGIAFIFIKTKGIYYLKTLLSVLALFLFSMLVTEIYQQKQTEIIVYNSGKNPGIHLIHGKENFIITEEKISEEEIWFHAGLSTTRKLGLNHPTFLLSGDSIINKSIAIKNRFIFFEGKTLSLNKSLLELNKTKLPDFIVNPTDKHFNIVDYEKNTNIITNKRFNTDNTLNQNNIHYTVTNGAFRKKW